jgi:Zn-dependent protease with chaperone function
MDLPPPVEQRAIYLDGRSNRKRNVTLRFSSALDIVEQDAVLESWSYGEVRRADGPPGLLRLSCETALPLARLEVMEEGTIRMVAANCRSLNAGHASGTQTWRIVGWSLAATASILGIAYFGLPYAADRLAPLVPAVIEQRIGEGADKQIRRIFGDKRCDEPAGLAALTTLLDKLKRAGDLDAPILATVVSSSTENAFALPAGRVYLFDGLLKKAQNPDELAGVLAHELGHVKHLHVLRRIIQTGGTSFLIGLLFGDVTGGTAMIFIGRELFDSSYSRDSEREADAFAIAVMHKLGRSPKPLGELLVRMTSGMDKKVISILSSHPLSDDRLAVMSKADPGRTGPALLSPTEWQALKNICKAR